MKRRSLLSTLSTGALVAAVAACSAANGPADEVTSSTSEAVTTPLSWAGWTSLSGGLLTDPSIFAYDRYHVGAVANHGGVWFNWFDTIRWTGWVDLGADGRTFSSPPVAVRAGNHVELFVVDSNGWLMHKEGTFNGTNAPTWSGWEAVWQLQSNGATASASGALATNARRPPAVVVSQPNNQVNVMATFADGTVKAIRIYGLHNWSYWSNLSGGLLYEPAAVSWGDSRLDVVAVGGDHGLYHRYSVDNGATWLPTGNYWEALEGNAYSTPSLVSWGANRLDVFASGRPGGQIAGVQHLAWTGNHWGTCSATHCWESLRMLTWQDGASGEMAAPVAITRGVGDIEVFAQGVGQGLDVVQMTASNPATWGNVQELTSCFRTGGTPAVVSTDNVGIDVLATGFAADGNGALYGNSSAGGAGFVSNGVASPPSCQIGYPGGPCGWPTNSCSDGAACGTDRVCACGPKYAPGTRDGHAVCLEEGNVGEPCFSDGTCNAGQIACRNGTCVATGHAGEPCNPGNWDLKGAACDENSACIKYSDTDYECETAGPLGDWCRYGGDCDPGGACRNYSNGPHCGEAGGKNEPCDHGACHDSTLTCFGGSCIECGQGLHYACCDAPAKACPGNLVCGADKLCAEPPSTPPPPPGCTATTPKITNVQFNHYSCDWPGEPMSLVLTNSNCATETVNVTLGVYDASGTQLLSQGSPTAVKIMPVGANTTISFGGPVVDGDYIIQATFDHGLGIFRSPVIGIATSCTPGTFNASKATPLVSSMVSKVN